MGWTEIVALIIQFGLPLAEKIWQLAATGKVPTQADWDALKALNAVREVDILKQRLIAAGIALDSDQAKALLALVQ